MATPVLIIGKSGSGKSTSMRNCINKEDWNLIRVLNKPLPFKGKINGWSSDDYQTVMKCLSQSKAKNIVLDDAGYLITNMFMNKHSSAGAGNGVFTLYNQIGDHFWNLIQFIVKLPEEKIVYVIMHEDINDFGQIKPKTIGKLLDEKVCIEGMFTIVLRAECLAGEYIFHTRTTGTDVTKTPMGMFDTPTIPNDLKMVDDTIREYYNIKETGEKTNA